ncbi:unnamed protein product [Ceutorhynchus assimilis]|uniref:Tudor domain-containing protein n=1 Tax=Ceutorhynchus assimilis TaxID=467358 RepID=A0A9N9MB20_9CUCU|nr:unnamed protein product [Ceutorhynchus assimilis]
MDIVENIMSHVNSVDCLLPVIEKPLKDMLVVVQFKELWYRGVVIHECRPQGYAIVTLLDYGNREEIECNIRQMSEIMRKIPAQAIRFNINNNALMDVPTLKIHQEIEVAVTEIVNWDNNEPIYMVNINRILGSAEKLRRTLIESQPKESVRFAPVAKCFMKIAESSAIIAPDRMLRIVHYRKDKLIVRTNELANLTKKVVKHVAWMKKKQETLPLTSLRNIDKTLASLPPALIEINYPPLERATDEGITLLRSLIEKKPRIRSIEVNGHIDFTVDGELLSTKITSQLTPPKLDAISRSHTTISENKKSVQTLFRDMPFVEPKKSRAPYACFSYHGATLTLVEWSPERRRLIEKLTSLAIPGDNEPFEPVQFGMCLAIREGFWCRAMATGDDDDKTIEVKFVDYGNIAKVDRANIRKLPEEM